MFPSRAHTQHVMHGVERNAFPPRGRLLCSPGPWWGAGAGSVPRAASILNWVCFQLHQFQTVRSRAVMGSRYHGVMSVEEVKPFVVRVGAVVVLQTEREPRVVTAIDLGRGVVHLGPLGRV